MKWFTKISFANKLALIGLIITALSALIGLISLIQGSSPEKGSTIQITEGNKSPIINSEKNVEINY